MATIIKKKISEENRWVLSVKRCNAIGIIKKIRTDDGIIRRRPDEAAGQTTNLNE